MPGFFDPKAKVTFNSPTQPKESIAIIPQPWQPQGGTDDIPEARPPLRRSRGTHNLRTIREGNGIVHVSTLTGERHVHSELEEVDNEPGMVRVLAEDVRPQRPLDNDVYEVFTNQMQHLSLKFFQRYATNVIAKATALDDDVSSVIASYLSPS